MSGVTKEQIAAAKAVNILDYVLSHEPNNVKRVGAAAYRLKDHDSLIISNGLWHWKSRDIGGKNVIDYLIKVRGYSFADAVTALAPATYTPRAGPWSKPPPALSSAPPAPDISSPPPVNPPAADTPAEERGPLTLPRRNADNKRVIEYLKNRGIEETLILDCIERSLLYESAHFHNCVFVGRDAELPGGESRGKARSAAIRGTADDVKRDVPGSDKHYGFVLPPSGHSCFGGDGRSEVTVFESPVDALSFQTLYPGDDTWTLSLGGTALSALLRFLWTHGEVRHVTVCTDNDEAGNTAAENIASLRGVEVTRLLPPVGKDWSETLMKSNLPRESAAREDDVCASDTHEADTAAPKRKLSFIGRLNKAKERVAANAARTGGKEQQRKYGDMEHG